MYLHQTTESPRFLYWKSLMFFVGIFITGAVCSQDNAPFVELTSVEPGGGDEDLKRLAHHFENVRIVGLGESTHGTHEFSTMRHRVFQYLVKYHGFDTFFLEADYANCLRVNGYIHGTHDDVKEAVSEIGLWPWASTEMVDIVNWMRAYNTQNEDRELSFVGVDAQQFATTLTQIDLVLEKYGLHVTDTLVYAPLSYAEFILLKKKKDLAPYLNLVVQKEEVNTQSFTEEDRHHYATLIRHFRQIIEIQNAGKLDEQSRLRDNYMAMNMLSYINSDTTAKGIFWAHNGHIFNLSLNEFGSKRWSGTAGGYLKETIGGEYFSLGFEFDEGSFNAYVPDSNSDINIEKKKYTLGEVTVGPSAGGTLAATYRELKSPLFIDFSQIAGDESMYMNYIGAVYFPGNEDNLKSMARYNVLGNKTSFDGMILIRKTTATHLLRNEKPENSGE